MSLKWPNYIPKTQKRVSRITAEGGWILAGQAASVLGALFLVKVLTEYLTPTQYGELMLGMTIATLSNQVVTGGIIHGVSRLFAPALEASDLRRYLQSSAKLVILASSITFMIAIILLIFLTAMGHSQWRGIVVSAMALSILSGINSIISGMQNAARQRATVALHAGLDAWLKIAVGASIMVWLGASSTAAMVGFVISTLVVTASQLWFLRVLLRRNLQQREVGASRSNLDWMTAIWRLSWPFSTWGAFTWAQQVSDRWALGLFGTAADVGSYAVVFQLGFMPISVFSGLMMTLVGPILYSRAGDASDQSRLNGANTVIYQLVFVSIIVTIIGFVFCLVFHNSIFFVLTSPEFRGLSYLLPWMVLSGGFFATGQLLLIKLGVELRSKEQIGFKIGTALLGIALNVVGAWLFGVEGVVASLVLFSSIYIIWARSLVTRKWSTKPSLAAN